MLRCGIGFLFLLLPIAAFAQGPGSAPVSLHAQYETYAAGVHVAEVETGFSFDPRAYQISLAYRTTGVVGFFVRGHQLDTVNGSWTGGRATPSRFLGQGVWRGEDRLVEIDYQQTKPVIRQLVPPIVAEREPVPDSLQVNSIDTLSALAVLLRAVATTGRCETAVRTFDGRRAVEIEAHTVGEELLAPTTRSSFEGKALRCNFSGRMLAGFKFGDDRGRDGKPMHGSAWLAAAVPGGPLLPVRMAFETRWFGDAIMYLTNIGQGSELRVARGK
jgi:hypothetical protein